VSCAMTDRIGARFLSITRVLFLMVAFFDRCFPSGRLPLDLAHYFAGACGVSDPTLSIHLHRQ
jgi:hypothetical protein